MKGRRFMVYLIVFLLGAVVDEFAFTLYRLSKQYQIIRRPAVQQVEPSSSPEPNETPSPNESSWIQSRRLPGATVI